MAKTLTTRLEDLERAAGGPEAAPVIRLFWADGTPADDGPPERDPDAVRLVLVWDDGPPEAEGGDNDAT